MDIKDKVVVIIGGARVGNPLDMASMVLFLCSDKAGFITARTSV